MTAGALGASGHPLRRRALDSLLANQATVARVRPRPGELRADLRQWEDVIERLGGSAIGAVIVEPVGGASSGAVPMPAGTLRGLRDLADEYGFLLIADEVMTGLGRTGAWFGCDHENVAPDLLAVGKGVAAGYVPIAAVMASAGVCGAFDGPVGGHVFGHTMAGAPLAAATALAVVSYAREHDLPARARTAGQRLERLLAGIRERHPLVRDVRGAGLQLALGLHSQPGRFPGVSLDVAAAAREEGLLVYPAGVTPAHESVMVAPPLTATGPEIDEVALRLDRAMCSLEPARPRSAADLQGAAAGNLRRPDGDPLLRA
jgi:adenosylmethionine-8-amino-7-oxononanoate aminotransferase